LLVEKAVADFTLTGGDNDAFMRAVYCHLAATDLINVPLCHLVISETSFALVATTLVKLR
jgi:hypothetical protein